MSAMYGAPDNWMPDWSAYINMPFTPPAALFPSSGSPLPDLASPIPHHTPASFATLPPEILTQICFEACALPPAGPPRAARALCLTCREFNDVLSWRANAPLYANIFKATFDFAAARRRFAGAGDAAEMFRVEWVSDELRRRWTALTRMRRTVRAHTLSIGTTAQVEADLWVAYIMLIEDDGQNLAQLRQYADLDAYMGVYWRENILPQSMVHQNLLPDETPDRSLALWIIWFTCSEHLLQSETALISHATLFALRPYAFAAHKYDLFCAPWYEAVMPLSPAPASAAASASTAPTAAPTPSAFDPLFDEPQPPPTAPPAQIPYFGILLSIAPPPAALSAIMLFSLRTSTAAATTPLAGGTLTLPVGAPAGGQGTQDVQPVLRPPFASELVRGRGSTAWDGDWKRATQCWDRVRGRGLAVGDLDVSGVWEGKFTFFDFDSYRDMLMGSVQAVYDGQYGSQPQVWRLSATRARVSDSAKRQILLERRERGGAAGGADADGEGAGEGEMTGVNYALLGLGIDDEWRWEDEEIVLLGSGHSAWGQFNLVGSIRAWDGLISLRKEYTPVARGTWLYRGYLVGDDYLVGRWRDTFTEKTQDGYEGIFALARRS